MKGEGGSLWPSVVACWLKVTFSYSLLVWPSVMAFWSGHLVWSSVVAFWLKGGGLFQGGGSLCQERHPL